MKLTLSWLRDHLDTTASLEKITETLTNIGLEVDAVEDTAAALKNFLVAEILEAKPHPDAAKLQICLVDNGREKLQIVCGAPNARAGLKTVLAPIGTVVPANGMVIKKSAIRGIESNGMLCSASELGLSDESDGILELAADAKTGESFVTHAGLEEVVLELNITPDRGDCLSVRGVARDLAAAGLGTLKPLKIPAIPSTKTSPTQVQLHPSSCTHFVGRTIAGVANKPSPDWLQKRLKAIGLRPISALVDITNYITYDLGRPLHVFDAAKLSGNIQARRSKAGESLHALNGKDYVLDDSVTVIADDKAVLAIGGIMGGEASGATPETRDVFLEVAFFDPIDIAHTGRRYSISSDARARFERGIDTAFLLDACDIATQMILDLCGGTASERVEAGKPAAAPAAILFDPALTHQLTGVVVDDVKAKEILEALGCTVSKDWHVTPPSWRNDLRLPVDLVEEITRIHGFEHIPSTPLPKVDHAPNLTLPLEQRRATLARRALAGRGMLEVHSWAFLHHDTATQFGGGAEAVQLQNPISSALDTMRPSLLPNLLEMTQRNHARGFSLVALCEIGNVYPSVTQQAIHAASVRSGNALPVNPHSSAREVNLFDAKADALAVLEACGAPTQNLQTSREAPEWYHPGRSGVLKLGKQILAHFGELHPALREKWDIKQTAVACEVFLDALPTPKTKGSKARPVFAPSDLMAVTRDYSFILSTQTPAASLLKALEGADKTRIEKAEVLSLYQDAAARSANETSIAVRVTFQPQGTALTDKDIEQLSLALITQALSVVGCRLSPALEKYAQEKAVNQAT